MGQDIKLAGDIWLRYQYVRDNGHIDYVRKAKLCEDFFVGLQWDPSDLALLRLQKRPAVTINKILSTISNVMGEQIFNRSEINYRPARGEASQGTADVISKVFRQISDNNLLDWVRSDVFADGVCGSRGFYDVRLDFADNIAGEARITQLNPKNVLIDPDAEEYDPDMWADVFVTKWLSPDQVALLYNEEDANALRNNPNESFWPYGYDSLDRERDRFGTPRAVTYNLGTNLSSGLIRNVRVIERQWKKLDKTNFFVNVKTGDMREVPKDWDRNRIAHEIEVGQPDWTVTKKLAPRIRWTAIADKFVLHDDWSPYRHFTVVPYFPHFRRGRTTGMVENLIGPQELLNKTSSQELHIVNTTANSGWIMRRNALQNMTTGELEQKGAQTGLVLEVDEVEHIMKIQPNQVPTGLDRISQKAEGHIDTISGVTQYDKGMAREDVSAKAVNSNKQSSSANGAKVMDNLRRTDHILARNVLDLVQAYYTEQRLMFIVSDRLTGQTEPLTLNEVSPTGDVINDLTIGEYAVTVTSEPQRDTFEDTQFDQALMLKTEAGITSLPDSVLIKNSKLRDKAEIMKEIDAASQSPEAVKQKQDQARLLTAQADTAEAEALLKRADAQLKMAQAQKAAAEAGTAGQPNAELQVELQKIQMENALEIQKMEMENHLATQKLKTEMELKTRQMEQEMALKQQAQQQDMQLKEKTQQDDQMLKRAQATAVMKQGDAAATQAENTPPAAAGGGSKHEIAVTVGAPGEKAAPKPKKFKMKKGQDGSIDVEEH